MIGYIYTGLGTLILVLGITSGVLFKKLDTTKKELAKAEESIAFQNAEIEKYKINLNSYNKTSGKVKGNIQSRYNDIVTTDKTCKAELNAIKRTLRTFYSRGQ